MRLTQDAYAEAEAGYAEAWERIDEWLYRLCAASDHSARGDIRAKITIVGRTYSAGLERHVVLREGQDDRLGAAAEHIAAHGSEIDSWLTALGPATGVLTPDRLGAIVDMHGRFTVLMAGICRTAPRSFASKYLHFHCPDVPVYDSYATAALCADFPLTRGARPFATPAGADEEYYAYCCRFWAMCERAQFNGLRPRLKVLDYMLWQRGAAIFDAAAKG